MTASEQDVEMSLNAPEEDETATRPRAESSVSMKRKALRQGLTDVLEISRAMFFEFFCMMIFIYVTTTVIVSSAYGGSDGSRVLLISFAYGISIVCMAYCSGHISGGHMNPAVTWMLLFIGDYTLLRAVCYNIAQFSGAVIGALLAWATTAGLSDELGNPPASLGMNTLNPNMYEFGGFLGELMGTALLCFVVYMTAVRGKGPSDGAPNLAPLVIGFAVFLGHLFLIPLTGCGINPARYFGPAFIHFCVTGDSWPQYTWIYWVGPFFGAFSIAGVHFFFEKVLQEEDDPFAEFRDFASGAGNYMNKLLKPDFAKHVLAKRRSTLTEKYH